ncbi:hypothetical protein GCM10023353_38970 [Tomitella cavernea]|uniref:Uncharacterized protein n=1 Tax=Tomitella cavernea TaxID=1387982 RepID=A0ABP9D9F5_9ACTN
MARQGAEAAGVRPGDALPGKRRADDLRAVGAAPRVGQQSDRLDLGGRNRAVAVADGHGDIIGDLRPLRIPGEDVLRVRAATHQVRHIDDALVNGL